MKAPGLASIALLLAASPAFAEGTDLAVLGGYTTSAGIDQKAQGIETLEIKGSFTWGLALSHAFSPRWGAEVSWAQQRTAVNIGTAAGTADLFDMQIGSLHANAVYRFGPADSRIAPFLLAGVGVSFLGAATQDTETKFSWGAGAGLKWSPSRLWGARIQARYLQVQLNDASSDYCDPFGFCQGSLHQFEVTGGVALRF